MQKINPPENCTTELDLLTSYTPMIKHGFSRFAFQFFLHKIMLYSFGMVHWQRNLQLRSGVYHVTEEMAVGL